MKQENTLTVPVTLKCPDRRRNRVVLMAGGFGRRLGEITRTVPKPLIRVGGLPVMEHIIHRMREMGLHHFRVTTHYLPEMIRSHCGDGSVWNVDIKYAHESSPLGTAGGLALVRDIGSDPAVVCNADILTDLDYGELLAFHERADAALTVVTVPYEVTVPFGVLKISSTQEVEGVDEKPTYTYYVSAGTYVIDPSVLALIKPGERLDMPQLIERVRFAGRKVSAYGFDGYWLDIGRPDDLMRADRDMELTALAS